MADEHVAEDVRGTPRVRPPSIDVLPSSPAGQTAGLIEELTGVVDATSWVFAGIEQVTGLRPGELRVVRAVARGVMPVGEVARRVGELDAAADATVTSLTKRGYMRRERGEPGSPCATSDVVRLTEVGVALLDQIAAVQLRLLDALVVTLDDEEVRGLRETLRCGAKALEAAADQRRTQLSAPPAPCGRHVSTERV